MTSTQAALADSGTASQPDQRYRTLAVHEVLSDLPNLDREQLLLLKSLEEAGTRRPIILDQVADRLEAQEARTPGHPHKPVSEDLVEHMGRLLAKDDARRSAAGGAGISRAD